MNLAATRNPPPGADNGAKGGRTCVGEVRADRRRSCSAHCTIRNDRFGSISGLRGRDSNPDYLIQSQASYH